MRALVWIVLLIAVAAGLTLLGRYSDGYVLVMAPPWRVEFSLSFLLIALAVAFILFHVLLRTLSATAGVPAQVRRYRIARRRERARAALMEALREFFAGRFGRAEKAAAAALESGEHPQIAAVLAARAAHELRAWDRRDGYLERARAAEGESDLPAAVTGIELLMDQRRFEEAAERLKALPHKHTAALRLELKAQREVRNWDRVVALAGELEKRGVFDPERAAQVRRSAIAENLRGKDADRHVLEESWRRLSQKDRADRRVAAAAARSFAAVGACARAQRVIEDALATEWDTELVGLYAECDDEAAPRIQRAESWLKAHPDDAVLLLTLARLCARAELWGKAQSYVDASIAVEPTWTAHLEAARLAERLGRQEDAHRHYRASLDLALGQLKAATGGRRRAAA